ncbi:MAG TPA: ergothioneine biosynthesis protein EgtB [Acidimicrobiales bacterium]|nr:ergothioneine biosynthesis protein EgtB [Acidimicrobiales bacterium]
MSLHDTLADALHEARRRSLDLLDPLTEAALVAQHSPLMSPLAWDLAHIGNYEDQWLLPSRVGARYDDVYDAFRHPRRDRPSLPLLNPAAARRYLAEVRGRVLDALADAPLDDGGFLYAMVVQHEHQHDETMLATLQLMAGEGYRPLAPPPPAAPPRTWPDDVLVEGGPFPMGSDDRAWAYDNERPSVEVDVPSFRIDTTPVTNAAYAAFVADSGYDEPRWWSDAGWAWRQEAGLAMPQFWDGAGGRLRFGIAEALPPEQPVQHVCWYEADAFARWTGKRLLTEAEWEKAASWDPATGTKRRYPWGDEAPTADHANLGQRHFGPAPVGAYPAGQSAYGCLAMVGDVWEWTASDFAPYPGFRAYPYREYSEVFYGPEYKVLRGGSWATHASAARTTFRNWDYPIRRQVFAGFRCAQDA